MYNIMYVRAKAINKLTAGWTAQLALSPADFQATLDWTLICNNADKYITKLAYNLKFLKDILAPTHGKFKILNLIYKKKCHSQKLIQPLQNSFMSIFYRHAQAKVFGVYRFLVLKCCSAELGSGRLLGATTSPCVSVPLSAPASFRAFSPFCVLSEKTHRNNMFIVEAAVPIKCAGSNDPRYQSFFLFYGSPWWCETENYTKKKMC